MSDRGQLSVPSTAWHFRWYHVWQVLSKKHRSNIDLCHYMRVVVFFAGWRWFWQYQYRVRRGFFLRPFEPLLALGVAATLLWATFAAPWFKWFWVSCGGVVALVILAYLLSQLAKGIADVFPQVGPSIGSWLDDLGAGVGWLGDKLVDGVEAAFCGVEWVYQRTLGPGGYWFFNKRLANPMIFGVGLVIAPWTLALVIGLASATYVETHWIFVGLLILAAAVAAGLALIFSIVQVHDRIYVPIKNKRAYARAAAPPDGSTSTLGLVWSWLVSKKHRICPLIAVQETAEPPKMWLL